VTSLCGIPVFATRARVTKVDACGAIVTGAGNGGVTAGLISTEIKPQEESGTEVIVMNGAGLIIGATKSLPQLKWDEVTITLANVDPEFIALITGQTLVMNDATPTPTAIGLQQRRSTYAVASFGWETWTGTDGMACSGTNPWLGYSLLPWVVEGRMSDLKFENGAASAVINGRTNNGTAWGVGINNIQNDHLGAASKLFTALPSDTHHHFQWVNLPAPAAQCGAITVGP
jgi:hypothetical protein